MSARQKQQTQRNTKKGGEHKPAGAMQMDLLPVLHDNYARDRDRYEHGERGGHVQRNAEGEKRNGDQGFAKAKG